MSSRLFSKDVNNRVICTVGNGSSKDYSVFISEHPLSYDLMEKTQCFPLYYYEEAKQSALFDTAGGYVHRDGITDFILKEARQRYGSNVGKEDIFYYVYGFLHSPEYRQAFATDLRRMLPRLPLVDRVEDFWAFSRAGRALADLHLNYENQPAPAGVEVLVHGFNGKRDQSDPETFRVVKMRHPKKGQRDQIEYNGGITITGIPERAYDYVVNGKSAIEWVMERYAVTTHKDSGITNDPNDWSAEVGNPRYILDLLLSVITVSLKTVEIVEALPKVEFVGAEV